MATATRALAGLLLAALGAPAAAAVLPFADAARLVLARGLEGEAARATLQGARAFADRAGALPGPSIAADVENFGADRSGQDVEGAQLTIAVAQPLRFGPRAASARTQARAQATLARAMADATARAQLAALVRVYAAAAAAEGHVALTEEREAIAARLAGNAARRLAAGDIAEVEARRVEVEAALAAAALQEARLAATAANGRLARLVGEPEARATPGWLDGLAGAPPSDAVEAAADRPLWEAEQAIAAGALSVERAERLPTADLTVGIRRFRDADATVGVAGITLGLPLWNGNRGAIARAQAAARRAELDTAIRAREAANRRAEALAQWRAGAARLAAIDGSALPAARRARDLSQRGYAAGALPYRDLADANATLIAVVQSRIATQQAIAGARAALMEITGDPALVGLPGATLQPAEDLP